MIVSPVPYSFVTLYSLPFSYFSRRFLHSVTVVTLEDVTVPSDVPRVPKTAKNSAKVHFYKVPFSLGSRSFDWGSGSVVGRQDILLEVLTNSKILKGYCWKSAIKLRN